MITTENSNRPTIFLGDLSRFCQEIDIIRAFEIFGEIEEIRLMRSKKDGKCLGYGFLTFRSRADATKAFESMNGQLLVGRKLKLDWAGLTSEKSEEKEIAENSSDAGRLQTAEIHFSFVSKQKKYVITEATIRSIFEEFGPVEDICIKKIEYSKKKSQHGYGFIHYPLTPEGIGAAIQATSVICQLEYDDVTYDCSLTHEFEQFLIHGGLDALRAAARNNHNSSNTSSSNATSEVTSNPSSSNKDSVSPSTTTTSSGRLG